MSAPERFTIASMQMKRPRKHSNTAIVKNYAKRILQNKPIPASADQIRQQGISLAMKLSP